MGLPEIFAAKEKLLACNAIKEEAKLVMTHFSHNGGLLQEELEELLVPKGFIVAYDGMLLEL